MLSTLEANVTNFVRTLSRTKRLFCFEAFHKAPKIYRLAQNCYWGVSHWLIQSAGHNYNLDKNYTQR